MHLPTCTQQARNPLPFALQRTHSMGTHMYTYSSQAMPSVHPTYCKPHTMRPNAPLSAAGSTVWALGSCVAAQAQRLIPELPSAYSFLYSQVYLPDYSFHVCVTHIHTHV